MWSQRSWFFIIFSICDVYYSQGITLLREEYATYRNFRPMISGIQMRDLMESGSFHTAFSSLTEQGGGNMQLGVGTGGINTGQDAAVPPSWQKSLWRIWTAYHPTYLTHVPRQLFITLRDVWLVSIGLEVIKALSAGNATLAWVTFGLVPAGMLPLALYCMCSCIY